MTKEESVKGIYKYLSRGRERTYSGEPIAKFIDLRDKARVVARRESLIAIPSPPSPERFTKILFLDDVEAALDKANIKDLGTFLKRNLEDIAIILEAYSYGGDRIEIKNPKSPISLIGFIDRILFIREGDEGNIEAAIGMKKIFVRFVQRPKRNELYEDLSKLSKEELLVFLEEVRRNKRFLLEPTPSVEYVIAFYGKSFSVLPRVSRKDLEDTIYDLLPRFDSLREELKKEVALIAYERGLIKDVEKFADYLPPEIIVEHALRISNERLYNKYKDSLPREKLREILSRSEIPEFAIEDALALGLKEKVPISYRPEEDIVEAALKGSEEARKIVLTRGLYRGRECEFLGIFPRLYRTATECPEKAAKAYVKYALESSTEPPLPDRLREHVIELLLKALKKTTIEALTAKFRSLSVDLLEAALRKNLLSEIPLDLCPYIEALEDKRLLEGVYTECPEAIRLALRGLRIRSKTLEELEKLKDLMSVLGIREYPLEALEAPPQYRIYLGLRGDKRMISPLKELRMFIIRTNYMLSLKPFIEIALDRLGAFKSKYHEYIEELVEYLLGDER